MSTSVKWFHSGMAGLPQAGVSGQVGTLLTNVLRPCLVAGFNAQPVTISVTSGVATATASGSGFLDDTVVLVAGATPSGLNGEKRVLSSASNVFTYDATGVSDGAATGTITAKMAPAGWEEAYTHTSSNIAAFRSLNVAGTQLLLRVDDSGTNYARLRGFESFASQGDFESATGTAFPTVAQLAGDGGYLKKSETVNATLRAWRLVADSRFFYLFVNHDSDVNRIAPNLCFGDIIDYSLGNEYGCVLMTNTTTDGQQYPLYRLAGYTVGSFLARSYTQALGAVVFGRYSSGASALGYGGMAVAVNPVSGSVDLAEVSVWESGVLRGRMPGLYDPLHNGKIVDNTFHPIADLDNHNIWIHQIYSSMSYTAAVDITGPWR